MTNRGFSIIELLVVMAIMGTLLSMVTFGFTQYVVKSSITNQTRELYGDLMEYRTKAIYEKKPWTFKFNTNKYDVYSSNNTTVAPVKSVALKNPITSNGSATAIVFDSRGTANVNKTVCVAGQNEAMVDAVIISITRTQIGEKRDGMDCDAANIIAK